MEYKVGDVISDLSQFKQLERGKYLSDQIKPKEGDLFVVMTPYGEFNIKGEVVSLMIVEDREMASFKTPRIAGPRNMFIDYLAPIN